MSYIDKKIEQWEEKFVVKSNAGTGLVRYSDADKIKAFLRQTLEEQREEMRKKTVELIKQSNLALLEGVEREILNLKRPYKYADSTKTNSEPIISFDDISHNEALDKTLSTISKHKERLNEK